MNTAPLNFSNQFLVAMPDMDDGPFARSVVYLFRHDEHGAAGMIINQPSEVSFEHLLTEMHLPALKPLQDPDRPVLVGGPVQPELGFVLHEGHGPWSATLHASETISVTHSRDILDAISQGHGPHDFLVSLGYAGWMPGQLEDEIANNYWLIAPAAAEVMFKLPYEARWEATMRNLGLDWRLISHDVGHS